MDILIGLLLILGFYIFAGLSYYVYAVIKSKEILGFWSWKVDDGYIGLCVSPKWLVFWLHWISKKVGK